MVNFYRTNTLHSPYIPKSIIVQLNFGFSIVVIHPCLIIFCSDSVKTTKDLFLRFEKEGFVMRIDEGIFPTAFKCATVSREELGSLRKIQNIVRKGRIASLEKDKIVFEDKR